MKYLFRSRFFWGTMFGLVISAVLIGTVPIQLWREISETQAKKQSLKIPSWAPLVESAQPAVVVITTEAMVEQPGADFPGLPGPFRFYLPTPPEKQRGQGSGFIINEDGYILTNQHVIDGAQRIEVEVGNNPRKYKAKVIGADEALDIALVQIISDESDPKKKIRWPYLPLGDSDELRLGEAVMALGSPLGLLQSVNVGIVSQKHRGGIRPNGRDLFVELIQLQMPINPGNSGGPVLDDSGRVVGVSESILNAGNAIAFCVPINIIKTLIPSLEKGGIEKSYLGIEPIDLEPDLAKKLGLPEDEKGAVIAQIYPNTPAKKAGLEVGDVVLEIDGVKRADSFKLREKTAYKGVGQIIALKIYRQGKGIFEIKVKLEKRPGQISQYAKVGGEKSSNVGIESIGIELGDTPEQSKKDLKLSAKNPGAQVLAVMPRSAAQAAGLVPGDVIVKVDNTLVTSAEHLKEMIDKAPKESTLPMLIWRGHDNRFVHLKKPSGR